MLLFIGKFYTDSGSRLPFGKLFVKLAENFPTDKIDLLKHLIHCKLNNLYKRTNIAITLTILNLDTHKEQGNSPCRTSTSAPAGS